MRTNVGARLIGKKVTGIICRTGGGPVVGLIFEDGTALTAGQWAIREPEEIRRLFEPMGRKREIANEGS